MKKFLLILTCLLGFSAAAWAEETPFYTFATAQNTRNNAYATNYDVTIEGMNWSVPGNQDFDGYVRIGGKSLSGVDREIYSKTAMESAINKIVINHNGVSNAALTVNSIKLTVASDANFSDVLDTQTKNSPSVSTAGSITFEGNWPTGAFYKFTFNVTNTSTSKNYGLDVNNIKFYAPANDNTLHAPTFSPAAGEYDNDQTVTISCSTSDAEIYYSTDNTNFSAYNAAIPVSTATTVYAYSKKGTETSETVSAAYTFKAATPTATVTGEPNESLTVSLATATTGATIYYTLNGDEPTTSSTPYTTPFEITEEGYTVVKAIAVKAGYENSAIFSRSYQIDKSAIVFDFTTENAYGLETYSSTNHSSDYLSTAFSHTIGGFTIDVVGKYRHWSSNSGYDLRLYKGDNNYAAATLTVTAPADKIITKIIFSGQNLSNFESSVDTYTSTSQTWQGVASSVAFTATDKVYVNTVSISYITVDPENLLKVVTTNPSADNEIEDQGNGEWLANNIVLTDAKSYVNTYTVTATEDVTYNRTYSSTTTWKPWYAPIKVSTDDFEKAIQLTNVTKEDGTYVLAFETVTATTMEANTPYVVLPKIATEAYTATDDVLYPADIYSEMKGVATVTGVYLTKEDMVGVYALASDGNFHPGTDKATLKPFRFFLSLPTGASGAPLRMTIDGQDATDGIINVVVDALNDGIIYNMQGVRVDNPTPGFYIINGKKVYVK